MVHRHRAKTLVGWIAVSIGILALSSTALTRAQDSAPPAASYVGSKVLLQGQVMDTTGAALPGAVIEIWQADVNGNYNVPSGSDPAVVLPDFQYFGTATADQNGEYAFLTLKPAPFQTSPARIHFKVKQNGSVLMTSQFYFAEDRAAAGGDPDFTSADDTLFLQSTTEVDADLADDGLRLAIGNIVLDLNGDEADILTPTTVQTEGPYYPAVDYAGLDNNLLSTAENDEPVLPTRFPIGSELTIASLRAREITGSPITLEQQLANGVGYSQYLASYISEGSKIYGLLTVPFGDPPPGGFKAIVFCHGYIPPDSYQTTERYVAYVGTLASHGFVVFKIDLRGHGNSEGEPTGSYYSPGYTIDAIAALKSLQTLDYVDPQGIGMWGHSMAGNLVMRALLVEPDIKAAVIWAGAVYSYDDFVKYRINDPSRPPTSGDNPTPSRRRSRALITLYGEPNTAHPFWQAVSLTANIDYLQAPLQIHHAANDTVVNIGYSEELAAVLAQHNKTFEYYRYEGGGHNIDSPYFTDAMTRTVEFFLRYL